MASDGDVYAAFLDCVPENVFYAAKSICEECISYIKDERWMMMMMIMMCIYDGTNRGCGCDSDTMSHVCVILVAKSSEIDAAKCETSRIKAAAVTRDDDNDDRARWLRYARHGRRDPKQTVKWGPAWRVAQRQECAGQPRPQPFIA